MIKKKQAYIFSGRAADYETLLTHLKINLAKVEGIDSANNWLLQGGWAQDLVAHDSFYFFIFFRYFIDFISQSFLHTCAFF